MQFQTLNRSDAEKIYAAVYNISGSTLSAGAAAYFVATSGDGISVSGAQTYNKYLFAGIVKSAIADSKYGRVQVYGYCSAYLGLAGSVASVAQGTQLDAVTSQTYLTSYAAIAGSSATIANPWNFVTLTDTYASVAAMSTTPQLVGVFVRAL
jgi:hypothetical protein